MPAKRAAPATASRRSKKSRPSTESTTAPESTNVADDNHNTPAAEAPAPLPPRGERWSLGISGSANVDVEYMMATEDKEKAYRFVCLCRPPFYSEMEEDEDDEDQEEKENEDPEASNRPKKAKEQAKCDGGDACLCNKPASEHPNHIWKLSYAGLRKFHTQTVHLELRDPDNFDMYTFNRHGAYGVLEVLQNLILDFEEASDNYHEQWAVCEGLAFFLNAGPAWDVTRVDGDTVTETYLILGRLFLSQLARLERLDLLKKDSEIQNLGLIMALFVAFGHSAKKFQELRDSNRQCLGPGKDKKKWWPHKFENQIVAYASKYDISLVGPRNIDEIVKKITPGADLPLTAPITAPAVDPFGFAKNLKRYKEEQGGLTAWMAMCSNDRTPIGGDNLDITTWTSEKRKEKSFDNKDPLSKEHLDALKQGMVMTRG